MFGGEIFFFFILVFINGSGNLGTIQNLKKHKNVHLKAGKGRNTFWETEDRWNGFFLIRERRKKSYKLLCWYAKEELIFRISVPIPNPYSIKGYLGLLFQWMWGYNQPYCTLHHAVGASKRIKGKWSYILLNVFTLIKYTCMRNGEKNLWLSF